MICGDKCYGGNYQIRKTGIGWGQLQVKIRSLKEEKEQAFQIFEGLFSKQKNK